MTDTPARDAIVDSLLDERTVDIVTTGRRSGQPRTTEIWTTVVDGRAHIAGTPGAEGGAGSRQTRDWLANLLADPELVVRLKTSVAVELAAVAAPVTEPDRRRRFFEAPEAAWYVEQVGIDALVADGPLVELRFTGEAAWLEGALRRGE